MIKSIYPSPQKIKNKLQFKLKVAIQRRVTREIQKIFKINLKLMPSGLETLLPVFLFLCIENGNHIIQMELNLEFRILDHRRPLTQRERKYDTLIDQNALSFQDEDVLQHEVYFTKKPMISMNMYMQAMDRNRTCSFHMNGCQRRISDPFS